MTRPTAIRLAGLGLVLGLGTCAGRGMAQIQGSASAEVDWTPVLAGVATMLAAVAAVVAGWLRSQPPMPTPKQAAEQAAGHPLTRESDVATVAAATASGRQAAEAAVTELRQATDAQHVRIRGWQADHQREEERHRADIRRQLDAMAERAQAAEVDRAKLAGRLDRAERDIEALREQDGKTLDVLAALRERLAQALGRER